MVTLLLTVVRITERLSALSKFPRIISYNFPSHRTIDFRERHFVRKRSIAFWFLSENLKIHKQLLYQHPKMLIYLSVSLSHLNSRRSNLGQYLARESIMWSTCIFVVIASAVPITCQSWLLVTKCYESIWFVYQNSCIHKLRKVSIPQAICNMTHTGQTETLQLSTESAR